MLHPKSTSFTYYCTHSNNYWLIYCTTLLISFLANGIWMYNPSRLYKLYDQNLIYSQQYPLLNCICGGRRWFHCSTIHEWLFYQKKCFLRCFMTNLNMAFNCIWSQFRWKLRFFIMVLKNCLRKIIILRRFLEK